MTRFLFWKQNKLYWGKRAVFPNSSPMSQEKLDVSRVVIACVIIETYTYVLFFATALQLSKLTGDVYDKPQASTLLFSEPATIWRISSSWRITEASNSNVYSGVICLIPKAFSPTQGAASLELLFLDVDNTLYYLSPFGKVYCCSFYPKRHVLAS